MSTSSTRGGKGLRLLLGVALLQASYYIFVAPLPLGLAAGGFSESAIGVLIGLTPLTQIAASFSMPFIVSSIGVPGTLAVGGSGYIAGAVLVGAATSLPPTLSGLGFICARIAQGLAFGLVLPTAYLAAQRAFRGELHLVGIATANGLALAVLPPLSLILYDVTSLGLIAAGGAVLGVLGLFTAGSGVRGSDLGTRVIRFKGPAFKRAWVVPLTLTVLFLPYWGVTLAYLQQEAHGQHLNGGLFFAFDGIAILLVRLPAGVALRQLSTEALIIVGGVACVGCVAVLASSLSEAGLIFAGVASGLGSGCVMTALLVETARRTGPDEAGGSFAYFSIAQASGIALGSVLGALTVPQIGFSGALIVSGAGMLLGIASTLGLSLRSQTAT